MGCDSKLGRTGLPAKCPRTDKAWPLFLVREVHRGDAPMKLVTPALLLTGALALTACNQTASAPAPAGAMASSSSTGCKGDIDRYRAVMSNDLSMGHVNQSVYTRA